MHDISNFSYFGQLVLYHLIKLGQARPRVIDGLQSCIDEHPDRKIIVTMNGFSNCDYERMANMKMKPTQKEIALREHLSLFCPKSKAWL